MKVIIGPFHPYLEDALVEEIQSCKKADLLSPLLVLVPSDSLRQRVKTLLARERRLNCLNVYVLTFYQLSLRLFEESPEGKSLTLCDDQFLEEALRQIIRMEYAGAAAFSEVEQRVGGCAALWQTMRDLKDGTVDPLRALEALEEGHFGGEFTDKVANLFSLYGSLLSRCWEAGIGDFSDIDIFAREMVFSSKFLAQFKHVFYYGFYDLTQVQVDLFQAVAGHYPTTLLFPLVQGAPNLPAWSFAQRFFERYVQGLIPKGLADRQLVRSSEATLYGANPLPFFLFSEEAHGSPQLSLDRLVGLRCTALSCFGAGGEVETTAKEILRLVSEEGFRFNEIGVVARALRGYDPWVKEKFEEHRIPFSTTAKEPLVQFPLAKAALLLLNLVSKDYLRSHVIDLLSSPFFETRSLCQGEVEPRPHLWDLITRRLGITKGVEGWRRLQRITDKKLVLEWVEEDEAGTKFVSREQIGLLWNLFYELYRDLAGLRETATWSQYVEVWKGLLEKNLRLGAEEGNELRSRSKQSGEMLISLLEGLRRMEEIKAETSLEDFIQTYQRWIEHAALPPMERNLDGVAVMDVMAARGIEFRALFVLGLNEGVFPRTIREDAFLRDRHRRVLESVLGYKVGEKLSAFDEEKLLFTLLVGGARERLYCLFQRSDEGGRPLAPSWYLSELKRALAGRDTVLPLDEVTVPRGALEKRSIECFRMNHLLPARELAVRLTLEKEDAGPITDLFSPSPSLYRQGVQAMESLERTGVPLSSYDGMVGPMEEYWGGLQRRGIAPTSLERYARCPFQYFADNILGLERLESPEDISGLGPSDTGQLLHLILKSFYEELVERGFFGTKAPATNVHDLLAAVAYRAFIQFGEENPTGYRLAWEIHQEELLGHLHKIIAQDLTDLEGTGYQPLAFEIEAKEHLGDEWPDPLKGLTVFGRMDRVDFQPAERRYRVVDYKFKSGSRPTAMDNNLRRSALRGERLQPPFYLVLGKHLAARREGGGTPTVEAAFYYLAPKWPKGPLSPVAFPDDAWEGDLGVGLKETLSLLLDGIQQGRFFIIPDDHCRFCEVSEVCRKSHPPTRWRTDKDQRTVSLRDLRRKELLESGSNHQDRNRSRQGRES